MCIAISNVVPRFEKLLHRKNKKREQNSLDWITLWNIWKSALAFLFCASDYFIRSYQMSKCTILSCR